MAVFVASGLIHMALPFHKGDFGALPDEDALMAAGRAQALRPGQYTFPHMTGSDAFKDPVIHEKCARGPVGVLYVAPNGLPNMGRLLGQQFVYALFVSFFLAYVAHAALPAGADYLKVFQVVGAVGFLAYGAAHISLSVWYYHKWSMTLVYLFDALVYGLLSAGIFGWMWP